MASTQLAHNESGIRLNAGDPRRGALMGRISGGAQALKEDTSMQRLSMEVD